MIHLNGNHHVGPLRQPRAPRQPRPSWCDRPRRNAGDVRGARHPPLRIQRSQTDPLHLVQLWIFPSHNGLEPRWEQRAYPPAERSGKLLPVVSDGGTPGTLSIDQDAQIFIAHLGTGEKAAHSMSPGRKAYAFLISGEASLGDSKLQPSDQARIAEEKEISIEGIRDAELILLDLPA